MATVPEPVSNPPAHDRRRTPRGAASSAGPRPDRERGVFETLLVLGGHPVELDAHLARLTASLVELFPSHSPPPLHVPSPMHPYGRPSDGTSAGDSPGALRITVAPGDGGELKARIEQWDAPRGGFLSLCDKKSPRSEVSLRSLTLAGGLGAHKWADRSLLDEAQAELADGALPLIVDEDGTVLEAARANVFAVRDGALATPPTDGRILAGVTRMRVLEIAGAMGVDLREGPLTRDDLLAADDVFLTGSIRGIERVDSLDGRPLNCRGEVANRVSAELWSVWRNAKKSGKSPEQNERESGEPDDQAGRSRDESRVAALRGISGRGRIAQRHSASSGPRSF